MIVITVAVLALLIGAWVRLFGRTARAGGNGKSARRGNDRPWERFQ